MSNSIPKVNVGVVGCGAISGQYFKMARNFPWLNITHVADLDVERARARAAEFGVGRPTDVKSLISDEAVDIVLNLTVPRAHAEVALMAVEAGKHTFCEKPLAISREEGWKVLQAASAKNLRVGCAPDTFMGSGIQAARKAVAEHAIGKPVAFTASMMCRGHESWHPSPAFYYEAGGGPMFDMGPYYLTALLQILGPVRRISGMASIAIPERTITHKDAAGGPGPLFGKKIHVETPDHVMGLMEFENGASGTVIQTFATLFPQADGKHPITVYGTQGTLKIPDPNTFDGAVMIRREGAEEFTEFPHHFVKGYGRAVGLADMAMAIGSGRAHRCSAEQAFAVLDLMQGFLDSARDGKVHAPATRYTPTAAMKENGAFGVLE